MRRFHLASILLIMFFIGIFPLFMNQVDAAGPYEWSFSTRGRIYGSPVLFDIDLDGQQEFLFCDNRDGLQVLDAMTGQVLWEFGMDGYGQSDPIIADVTGDSIPDVIVNGHQEAAALNGVDGSMIWWYTYEDDWASQEIFYIADIANDTTLEYVARHLDGSTVVINGETGNATWKRDYEIDYRPLLVNAEESGQHIVVVESTGIGTNILLLNGTNGEVIWELPQHNLIRRQPIMADLTGDGRQEIVFGSEVPIGEKIVAIDALNGTTIWEFQSEMAVTGGNMQVDDLESDGVLEIVVDTEFTHVLNGSTGEEIWAYPGSGYSRTVAIGNLLNSLAKEIVVIDQAQIIVFDSETGDPLWHRDFSGAYDAVVSDFDDDGLDEILCFHLRGAFVIEGGTGQITWYDPFGMTIWQVILSQPTASSTKYAILISDYRIRSLEISGFDPNTETLMLVAQYLPAAITIVFLSMVTVLYLRRRSPERGTAIRIPQRLDSIWQRVLTLDPTNRRFRVSIWLIVLLTPFVWAFTLFESSFLVLIAPLWWILSSESALYPSAFGYTYGFLGIPPYQLVTQLLYVIPMVVPLIILELNLRGNYRLHFPKRFIWLIPAFAAAFGLWAWTMGGAAVIIPVPISIIAMVITDVLVRRAVPERVEGRRVPEAAAYMQAVRGGEFVGNRFRFKVKVINDSNEVVTDVKVAILSYPVESLQLETESSKSIAKLEPKGFRSPTFEFLPTTDCVKGSIIATVSFVDFSGTAHSKTTEPYVIRAVCDLLRPQKVTPEEFMERLKALEQNEMVFRVDDWTPEEMHSKALQTLESANFHEVASVLDDVGDHVQSRISGWAKGVYTEKNLGVEIIVSGKPSIKGATCTIRVAGEDVAMILPAIDEIAQKIQAWLCPVCTAKLPEDSVTDLKKGRTASCPFCGVSLNR